MEAVNLILDLKNKGRFTAALIHKYVTNIKNISVFYLTFLQFQYSPEDTESPRDAFLYGLSIRTGTGPDYKPGNWPKT